MSDDLKSLRVEEKDRMELRSLRFGVFSNSQRCWRCDKIEWTRRFERGWSPLGTNYSGQGTVRLGRY